MPTQIIFGPGTITDLREILTNDIKPRHPLIVTDKGIVKSGIIEKIVTQVPEAEVFDEIEANPKSTTVNRAGEYARKIGADLIIAPGGGSPMDAGKAVALLAKNKGGIEDYEGKEKYTQPPLPVVAIPTTCGTGSEVTWVAVITDVRRKFKMGIKGRQMFPVIALVDPDLLNSLPLSIIASTGIDALTHAIEAYTSRCATFITDTFALKAIELILNSLENVFKDTDRKPDVRNDLMLGSTLAGIAFGNSDVGAVHCVSESIGAIFDIPHGIANSIFLPFIMTFNLPACTDKLADIAAVAGVVEEDKTLAAQKLIEQIKTLSRTLQIPSFKDTGIPPDQFQLIAEYSFKNNSNTSNPRKTTVEDYINILNEAFNE